MGAREKIEERIRRKEQEIAELTARIAEARAYIQGMQEASKMLPRDGANGDTPESVLRTGSTAYRAMEVLRDAEGPLHITDILKAIGTSNTKANRILVGGTLSRYVRGNQIFVRTGPNTFALANKGAEHEPPEDFGTDG
jgi:hypothetical protein